jgi:hypothetical protein
MPSKQINLSIITYKVDSGANLTHINPYLFYVNLYVYIDIVLVNRKFHKPMPF